MRLQKLLQFFSRSLPPAPAAQIAQAAEVDRADTSSAPPSRREHLLDRLALQTAIIQHLEWCVLFNEHLSLEEHPNQRLPRLPSAEESGLGHWLTQVRQELGPEHGPLNRLTQEHGHFHQLAQNALSLSRQGRMDLASTLLNTEFERSRAKVLELLRQMQKG